MNLRDVRENIAACMNDIGLNGYPYPGGNIELPAGVVGAMRGPAHVDFDGGMRVQLEVWVLLSVSDMETAFQDVDDYLEPGNPKCVADALEHPDAIGVSVDVQSWETVPVDTQDLPYNGLRFVVEVLG